MFPVVSDDQPSPQESQVDATIMKRFYDTELENFRNHLIKMGEISIQQVKDAIQALVESDVAIAKKVIAGDDELDDL